MRRSSHELALFEQAPDGSIRLVGRLTDKELIAEARKKLVAVRRTELARLERGGGSGSDLRLVRDEPDGGSGDGA